MINDRPQHDNLRTVKATADLPRAGAFNRLKKGSNQKLMRLSLAAILAGFCLLSFPLLTANRFGTYHDDSIYVATARAIADGQGYRIISLPNSPYQTKYPPLYPLVLAAVWKVMPQFPQNLNFMMFLSMMALSGFLLYASSYLLENEYVSRQSLVVVNCMTALNWRTMILATSIYSEMLFAVLTVAALYAAEKYEKEPKRLRNGITLGLLIGLAFLTRSSGVSLLIAVGFYFWFRRRWRLAVLPVGLASLFVIAWTAWCYAHRTTSEASNAAYYTSYLADLQSIIQNISDRGGSQFLGLLSIVGENLVGAIIVSIPVVCLGLNYDSMSHLGGVWLGLVVGLILLAFLVIAAGFIRLCRRGFRLLHIYVLSYLILHLFWPYASYDRFLMCVLPFLLLFFITELELPISLIKVQSGSSVRRASRVAIAFLAITFLLGVCFLLYTYTIGVRKTLMSLNTVAASAAEDSRLIQWINQNTEPEAVLICYRDPKYYLYTNRKAITFSWPKQGSSWEGQQPLLHRIISESNGRYLILTSTDFNHDYDEQLQRESLKSIIEQDPKVFTPVFVSEPDGVIYRIESTE